MYDINRIDKFSKYGIYTDMTKKVKETSKDERNNQEKRKEKESFKDVFERSKGEEKNK